MTEGQHTYDYKCEIMLGRFVHIVLSGQQKNLTLCEVMVYGTVLGKSPTQLQVHLLVLKSKAISVAELCSLNRNYLNNNSHDI